MSGNINSRGVGKESLLLLHCPPNLHKIIKWREVVKKC